jgi:phage repressor protein C with HTH and peptisase S24 domain
MGTELLTEFARNSYRYQKHIVTGGEMDPTIRVGDIVIYDITEDEPQHGCLYLFACGDWRGLRRVDIRAGGAVRLFSDSPHSDDELIPRERLMALLCLGRIVYHFRRL